MLRYQQTVDCGCCGVRLASLISACCASGGLEVPYMRLYGVKYPKEQGRQRSKNAYLCEVLPPVPRHVADGSILGQKAFHAVQVSAEEGGQESEELSSALDSKEAKYTTSKFF